MKLASVLAGATAVALALTATAASAGPDIDRGAVTGYVLGTVQTPGVVNTAQALNAFGVLPGHVALFTMDMNGFSNNSTSQTIPSAASFSLTGTVTPDCAYYTGGTSTAIDLGQIGINNSDNNPNDAFHMVDQSRTLTINSNLAGCNTKNTVTLAKTNLKNNAAVGFDPDQFTNEIPVSLGFKFTASNATSGAEIEVDDSISGAQPFQGTYGAWKSPLNMQVRMTNPNKALLAGTYNGSVSVTIAVAQ